MKDNLGFSNLIDRASSATPPFWKKMRTLMVALGGVGAAIMVAPVALPAALVAASGYLVTIGAVGTALASLTKNNAVEDK